jgi:hypothetical protein
MGLVIMTSQSLLLQHSQHLKQTLPRSCVPKGKRCHMLAHVHRRPDMLLLCVCVCVQVVASLAAQLLMLLVMRWFLRTAPHPMARPSKPALTACCRDSTRTSMEVRQQRVKSVHLEMQPGRTKVVSHIPMGPKAHLQLPVAEMCTASLVACHTCVLAYVCMLSLLAKQWLLCVVLCCAAQATVSCFAQ